MDIDALPAPSDLVPDATAPTEAREVFIQGVVQGVGFRPFTHRLAMRHGLAGWVRNEAGSVRIMAEGEASALERFARALEAEAPPLARIDRLEVNVVPRPGLDAFRVEASAVDSPGRLPVSPDVAMCGACEAELLDAGNRRFRYPFITCTDCGPRFTVIESMPYDRARTTMRRFTQCPACLAEYEDPGSRRYHSETNSCAECGPRIRLEGKGIDAREGEEALAGAVARLRDGCIVAVRGLGGFHLAVDAGDAVAIRRLRERKRRDAKPLAVMVPTLEDARRLAEVSTDEAALLQSPERPIVLLQRRGDAPLAAQVAPGLSTVGVMLAYTPLHRLLLEGVARPLVMTSGNLSDEPIATANEEARQTLDGVADCFLLHDREIVARYDDSLVRHAAGGPVFLRRARGFAPLPLGLPVPAERAFLAVGPHLKNTFTVAQEETAWVSQHVGDLENFETLAHFDDALERFRELFRLEPLHVVRDLHPGYLSTRVAEDSGLTELTPVQHHHAHIAAVQGEHALTGTVLGLAFDGTGYGEDGRVWGCEFLASDLRGYRRLAHLRYAPLPGGDRAARSPWRTALGYLSLAPEERAAFDRAFRGVAPEALRVAEQQIARGVNAPEASSLGRLFDAAAAVLGVRTESRFEGQAPMELESLAGRRAAAPFDMAVRESGGGVRVLDPVSLLVALGEGTARGQDVADLAARFHETVARATADLAIALCEGEALEVVALGGGCFQNARLLASVKDRIEDAGLSVLVPRLLGPNDGAVSYGQAVVAAARMQD
jgi:hydrogenase maturation protein HypF